MPKEGTLGTEISWLEIINGDRWRNLPWSTNWKNPWPFNGLDLRWVIPCFVSWVTFMSRFAPWAKNWYVRWEQKFPGSKSSTVIDKEFFHDEETDRINFMALISAGLTFISISLTWPYAYVVLKNIDQSHSVSGLWHHDHGSGARVVGVIINFEKKMKKENRSRATKFKVNFQNGQ